MLLSLSFLDAFPMKAELSYLDFLAIIDATLVKDSDIRYGQHYFNVLYRIKPKIANAIRATDLDPFFKDRVSYETEKFVKSSWHQAGQ